MNEQPDADQCARYLKALGEPARLKIVEFLQGGRRSVSDIATFLEVDVANASHHLRVLFNAGLLKTEREGKFIRYYLNPKFLRPRARPKRSTCSIFGCCRIELGERPS